MEAELARMVARVETLEAIGASRVIVNRGTSQSIPDATATKIQYNTVEVDNLAEWDASTNYRFTAKKAGTYHVDLSILFDSAAWTATESMYLDVYKNVAVYRRIQFYAHLVNATGYFQLMGSCAVPLLANDYIEASVYQDSSGAKSLFASSAYNFMNIMRVN